MPDSRERKGRTFSREEYTWEADHMRELSASISYILTHPDSLSVSDLVMIKAAHRFAHDAGLALSHERRGEVDPLLLQAGNIAREGFDGDELTLKRALGASMNVFNHIVENKKGYQLLRIEIDRTDEFFGKLAVNLHY